ncbi:mitochondrial splicing system protein [Modicella reniformis]|uniref:Mitochondrial splicing system protein n=1 Tax=Modicella reniformis TaxID=1440133 RepID=A0A9P6J061_9FUNG|nr:mitochondrial splicing system protein [Modicella reniformis]
MRYATETPPLAAMVSSSADSILSASGTLVSEGARQRSSSSTMVQPHALSHSSTTASFDSQTFKTIITNLKRYLDRFEELNDHILEAMTNYDELSLGLRRDLSPLSTSSSAETLPSRCTPDLEEQRRTTAEGDCRFDPVPTSVRTLIRSQTGVLQTYSEAVGRQLWKPFRQQGFHSRGYQTGKRERPTELRYANTHLDTIFALSTHPGKAGIAVIRVSGPQAKTVLRSMTPASSSVPKTRHFVTRRLLCPQTNELLDKGMVVWFPGPRSFTGEDTIEFHCHGGKAVVDGLLKGIGHVGPQVRLAEAGEFARRAFENDKLDLTEVEGLADLLNAETEAQRRLALRQADGGLKSLYENWRAQLIQSMALIEALIDFGEDENIEDDVYDNAKRQAAIVSSIPGTTRDVVEVSLDIGGYPILIGDTAGLRSAQDEIEMEGIRRAQDRISLADINIAILPITDFQSTSGTGRFGVDPIVLDAIRKDPKTLVLINKMDLSGSNTELIMSSIRLELWPDSLSECDLGNDSNGASVSSNTSAHRLWAISCQTGDGIGQFLQDFIKILKEKYVNS